MCCGLRPTLSRLRLRLRLRLRPLIIPCSLALAHAASLIACEYAYEERGGKRRGKDGGAGFLVFGGKAVGCYRLFACVRDGWSESGERSLFSTKLFSSPLARVDCDCGGFLLSSLGRCHNDLKNVEDMDHRHRECVDRSIAIDVGYCIGA